MIAAALSRSSRRKTILMVTHQWGGGTERHIRDLLNAVNPFANVIILRLIDYGIEMSLPALPDKSVKLMESERDLLMKVLRSFNVDRVHIHQIIGREAIIGFLIGELGLPFDLTVHDYYWICPQMHLSQPNTVRYCGELGEGQCNSCVEWNSPFGCREIREWRNSHAWFIQNAQRVICPSNDVRNRIGRYYSRANLLVVPHESNAVSVWAVTSRPVPNDKPLRVLLMGFLSPLKGRNIVEACLRGSSGEPIEFMLIGKTEPPLARDFAERFSETGEYKEAELSGLLKELAPHVLWFPQLIPETYSYTLSAAIESGLPIAASRLGALPERLEGRPLTWLINPPAPAEKWLATFQSIRTQLSENSISPQTGTRAQVDAYYPDGYLDFTCNLTKC